MATLLIHHIRAVLLNARTGETLSDAAIAVHTNVIVWVGPTDDIPSEYLDADRIVNAADHVVIPGLVNTHHHLYQTLTRAVATGSELFPWLTTLYPMWARLTAESVYTSALVGMAELMLSGCTTTSDHLYLFPNDASIDDEIRAGADIGMRFHAARGSMSLGESDGGLPPDSVVQSADEILQDTARAIEEHHDPAEFAMTRLVVAPCSPFSVTADLMRESAVLARHYGVAMHTHLAETHDEQTFCLETFGHKPVAYAEDLGWVGSDVWWAHGVVLSEEEVKLVGSTRTGVAHCPTSNMRLASGIAPVTSLVDTDARVGIGVDGSASNDGSHMLGEVRQTMLLQRVARHSTLFSHMRALELATIGGAEVLGRSDIGTISVGKAADIVGFDLNDIAYTGALHDPVAALVFCAPTTVSFSVINGRVVVENRMLQTIDLGETLSRHRDLSEGVVLG
ncbi:Guanine deaminase; Hydroxydechloroatrazine ethylaminohydrolase [hydrothermal vent metagenome]|uniref:Guanine deaminase Hydroxydechloroatrazine ethylaminohydrolase n=1 Tax=hydrothermal vent metagenome TaxID=652676 RepID=A0A3B0RYU6_9ZZZZ